MSCTLDKHILFFCLISGCGSASKIMYLLGTEKMKKAKRDIVIEKLYTG